MDLKRVKKRYIVGAVAIVFLLWKCSGNDDELAYTQQRQMRAADDARYMANQEAESQGQPQPYVVAPSQAPVIVNTPPAQTSSSHIWDYLMMHTLLNHSNQQPAYQPRYQARSRNVTNVRNETNVTNITKNYPSPASGKSAPLKPRSLSPDYQSPSVTARSYNVAPPPPSSMTRKTWATSSKKGWGSSTSYKSKSTSFKSSRSGRRR